MSTLTATQLRALSLASTVPVPATFPELGLVTIADSGTGHNGTAKIVNVDHVISPRLKIARSFFLQDVSAIFVPENTNDVDFNRGTWLLGSDVGKADGKMAIAYVREDARVLMQVEVGMTAAESAEYYPPLPGDRSVDHYNLGGTTVHGKACLSRTSNPRAACN